MWLFLGLLGMYAALWLGVLVGKLSSFSMAFGSS